MQHKIQCHQYYGCMEMMLQGEKTVWLHIKATFLQISHTMNSNEKYFCAEIQHFMLHRCHSAVSRWRFKFKCFVPVLESCHVTKKSRVHPLGNWIICNLMPFWLFSKKQLGFQPAGGARASFWGSPKRVRFILWQLWTRLPNFKPMHQIVPETFEPGVKVMDQLTDQLTSIANP